jgi:uncharacterized protein (TIGR04222 family)
MLDPFALDGHDFLLFYAGLLAIAWGGGRLAAARFRPEGRVQRVADPDALAMLNGGAGRLAETAIARLMAAQALHHIGADRFAPANPRIALATPPANPLDRAMLTLPMPARWRDLARVVAKAGPRLSGVLEQQGLYMAPAAAARLRAWRLMPLAVLLMIGAARLANGVGHDRPVGFLVALMLLTLGLLVAQWPLDRRTRAGIRAVRLARTDHDRLRRAPLRDEMGVAFALFGTSVLAGSILESLHRLRAASGDAMVGDGGGDGGSDGGGGCGAGGCGGCGS